MSYLLIWFVVLAGGDILVNAQEAASRGECQYQAAALEARLRADPAHRHFRFGCIPLPTKDSM